MNYIRLNTGTYIPQIGLGTFPLNGNLLSEVLTKSYKTGYRSFDTAWLYKNEKTIGRFLTTYDNIKREEVFLTSKLHVNDVYLCYHPHYRLLIKKKSIAKAYVEICKRLHTNYLDLFLLHGQFPNYEYLYKCMEELYISNKCKAIGVSNFKKDAIKKLLTCSHVIPAINQIEINPYNTRDNLIKYCQENGIVVEAYSPFGRGLITKDLFSEKVLQNIAKEKGKSVAQIIIRWLIQKNIVAIPRSSKQKNLIDNINVFDFDLTRIEMEKIDGLNKNLFTGGGKVRVEND